LETQFKPQIEEMKQEEMMIESKEEVLSDSKQEIETETDE